MRKCFVNIKSWENSMCLLHKYLFSNYQISSYTDNIFIWHIMEQKLITKCELLLEMQEGKHHSPLLDLTASHYKVTLPDRSLKDELRYTSHLLKSIFPSLLPCVYGGPSFTKQYKSYCHMLILLELGNSGSKSHEADRQLQ